MFTSLNNTSNIRAGYCFTDFDSFRSADGFDSLLCAHEAYARADTHVQYNSSPGYSNRFPTSNYFDGKTLMRSHLQVGGNVRVRFCSLNTGNTSGLVSGQSTGIPWPNGPDFSLILHPVYLHQEDTHLRGKLPGLMFVHNNLPLEDKALVTGVAGYSGRDFRIVDVTDVSARACVALDVTGPWR